jgi:hypothetical protein
LPCSSTPILITAATVFHQNGRTDVEEIEQAYQLLSLMLGVGIASTLFAVALLASGVNSTVTATLAGQIVMEGFLHLRIPDWARRLIRRGIAIIPVVFVTALYGERHGQAPGIQPGGAVDAIALCRHSLGSLRLRSAQDGYPCHPSVAVDVGMGDCRGHPGAQCQFACRHFHRSGRLILNDASSFKAREYRLADRVTVHTRFANSRMTP